MSNTWSFNEARGSFEPPEVSTPHYHLEAPPQVQQSNIRDGALIVADNNNVEVVRLGKQLDGTYGIRIADTSTGTVTITTSGIVIRNAAGTEVIRLGRQTTGRYGLSSFDASGNRIIDLGELASSLQGMEIFNTSAVRQVRLGQLVSGYGLEAIDASGNTVTLDTLAFRASANLVAANESTTSTAYTDLATSGPSVTVTIGTSGRALVSVTCSQDISAAGHASRMSFAIAGATTVAATDDRSVATTSDPGEAHGALYLVTGLNSGSHTFTAKYRSTDASNTAGFSKRHIVVTPF